MEKQSNDLTKQFIFLLAATCGIVVANMYYVQPIGTQVVESFQVSTSSIGSVTMLTQVGYALGLLFIVPLGDVLNKRRLIISMAALSSLSLLGAFFAPNFQLFILAAFIIGLLSVVPQIIIPYGAVLAGPEKRGQVMGKLLSGLLVGILLSRTFSGVVASFLPWRSIYLIAPLLIILLTVLLTFKMPKDPVKNATLSYMDSLKSIPLLIKKQRVLCEAAVSGFFMFGTFSIFWSTLIFYISSPIYNWGTFEAGILAIFGLAGAVAAPLVGKLSDQYAQRTIVWMGIIMQTVSFIILHFFAAHILPLILSIILLDIGNQFGQVANQTRVQNLGEQVSNRNNTVFMFSYFIGGALGSFLGTTMWGQAGWVGVTLTALSFQLLAIIFHFVVFKKQDQ